jgi:hypothetical protein
MSIFESLVLNLPHRERIQNDRQQTLNCALSVDFLWIKKFDRTNPDAFHEALGYEKSDRPAKSGIQTFPATAGIRF